MPPKRSDAARKAAARKQMATPKLRPPPVGWVELSLRVKRSENFPSISDNRGYWLEAEVTFPLPPPQSIAPTSLHRTLWSPRPSTVLTVATPPRRWTG